MASKRGEDAEDLNLVPIMNLVTILIPFLLMAAEFVSLAVIDSTLPAIGAPTEAKEQEKEDDKPPLNLSVIITNSGYTVAGSAAVLKSNAEGEEGGPTIPCKNSGCPTVDDYNVKELRRLLNDIKDEYGDEENIILVPESKVPYEVLVVTMDASRDDPDRKDGGKARILFPYVVIAGGAK
jgi:biopolymer transport protein ExbD